MPRKSYPIQTLLSLAICTLGISGCSSKVMQHDNSADILRNRDYESKVTVQEDAPPPGPAEPSPAVVPLSEPPLRGKHSKYKRHRHGKGTKMVAEAEKPVPVKEKVEGARQPPIEDHENFKGRRPLKDPLHVGEKVTLALSYFRVIAGNLELKVKPFAQVNHERAYHLEVTAKTNSFFGHVYAVDDTAVTYLSYDRLTPLSLQISIKESKQLAEARTFFDWKALTGDYWQKRITKEHGEESKSIQWKILDYSQNVISAAFYMRMFKMEPGNTYSFRVADEGKNIVFKGEVLRREKLDTDIGEMDTLVVRPTLTVDGAFAPVGEITFWLTDDDRKFLVRIESKIKIGTLVARVIAIERGEP